MPQPEPWLRGYLSGTDPLIAQVLYSLQAVREDVAERVADLSDEELWQRHGSVSPVGFQIRHAAGSVDRLLTYAQGQQLSEQQLREMRAEDKEQLPKQELLERFEQTIQQAEGFVKTLRPSDYPLPREVGRQRLPTTVGALVIHIAEHTQRHVGEAIVTAKLVRDKR